MIEYDGFLVGDVLRNIRNENKLTQREMAEIIDVSHIHYSKIEQGERKLQIDLMIKIISIFRVDANLFFGTEDYGRLKEFNEMNAEIDKLDKTGKKYIFGVWKEILYRYTELCC